MIRKLALVGMVLLGAAMARVSEAQGTATLSPLTSFGTNGWLAPGSISYLGNANNERGLAFNPVTKNVVLVSRTSVNSVSNNVVILNGTTGSLIKTMNPDGISGGTFQVNMAGVGSDGAIYVNNLVGNSATPGISKVYAWPSESSTAGPSVPFQNTIATSVLRFGDSFDVFGSGATAKFVMAGGGATGLNSVFAAGTLDGSNTSTTYPSIPNTTTSSNDYRLSLAFVNSATIIGNQGGIPRFTTFDATTATATAMQVAATPNPVAFGAAQRALDYTTVGGVPVMAILDSNSSVVQVYNVSNPAQSILLASLTTTSGTLNGNIGGTGQLAWGEVNGDVATLYAMNSNQGIQAMVFAVPEPGSIAMVAAAAGLGFAGLRRRGLFGRRS